jgi:hypothetical protein
LDLTDWSCLARHGASRGRGRSPIRGVAPAPLTDLALVRIVFVTMELLLLLVPNAGACRGCNLDYQRWLAVAPAGTYHPIPVLKLLLLPLGWGCPA